MHVREIEVEHHFFHFDAANPFQRFLPPEQVRIQFK